jgi:polyribonucleotide nucleotidyltransferase
MNPLEKSVHVGDQVITFQVGKVAKQAAGSVLVKAGGTVVLVAVTGAKEPRPGIDFLPLTVDYQEKMSAAGRIPGGFFKREGKPRDEETLTSRLIDRSIRPLFADGWNCETQVTATVFSADPKYPADTLALCGASLALEVSDLPFQGPIASRDAIVMVEGGGKEVSERDAVDALLFAHTEAQKILDVSDELKREAGKPKRQPQPTAVDPAFVAKVRDIALPKLQAAYAIREKQERYAALDEAKKAALEALVALDPAYAEREAEVSAILGDLKHHLVRETILSERARIDGRGLTDIRPITTETGVLPRTHGSALFTRGETQALVSVTLGTSQDEQKIEDLLGDRYRSFMLHYNFPPYSVGEVKPLRGPGRREIGHGALAERALKAAVQRTEQFPYVVRVMSDILESNGSSSMATVCGGSLALMDAGVPMKGPCAGIAMGLIKEGERIAILSDILGDEDHLGDMDFKVAGTENGITAIQMDIKISGVSREILEQALEQARQGRLHILSEMAKTIETSRVDVSDFAPRITTLKIKVDRIRDVIGPGGKVIKDIVARTGCQVNVEDDGTVQVASSDGEASRRAIKMIQDLTQEPEIGKLYLGTVRKIMDFGAFVEIFPGTDGLIHISELANRRVARVEDVLQEGDEVLVKVIGLDKGKIKLSRKEAIADEEKRRASSQANGAGSDKKAEGVSVA